MSENNIDIFYATFCNDIASVRQYIADGGNVNLKNATGDTPLLICHNLEIAKALISAGADVNAKGKYGLDALHLANDPDMVRLLLESGADMLSGFCEQVEIQGKKVMAPVFGCSNYAVAKVLSEHGAITTPQFFREGYDVTALVKCQIEELQKKFTDASHLDFEKNFEIYECSP